jgi:hypothetical protein
MSANDTIDKLRKELKTEKFAKILKWQKKYIKIIKMWQIMRKIACVSLIFLFSIAALYANDPENFILHIQGTGSPNFVEGFKFALEIEANAAGYQTTTNSSMADYSIRFSVEFDQTEQKSKFIVTLFSVKESLEVIAMEYYFADEEEMMLYSQLVFFLLIANIEIPVVEVVPENDNWRHKWLYITPSLNYSLLMFKLNEKNLVGGTGVSDEEDASIIAPLDNRIIPTLGLGLGLEFQFLDFMSIEPHAHISFEEASLNELVFNLLFSLKLKFPLKFFNHLVISPYGAAAYSMYFSQKIDIAGSIPMLDFLPIDIAVGGGIQVAMKTGNNDALFFDASFMYFGDISTRNQFYDLYAYPPEVFYNYSILSFGIGYKFGLLDRKR